MTKIVRLRFISPGEVVKILTPFKTAAGVYQAHEPARLLFLTEVPAKIADLLKIIEVLDVDTFASIQVELYPVRYAGVEDLARELTQIVTQVFTAAGRGRTLFRIIPVPQVNAIMVFSGEQGLTVNIREWIAKLDQPASEANERIFVYPLSHATAETLAGVLEKVFRRDAAKSPAKSATPTTRPAGADRPRHRGSRRRRPWPRRQPSPRHRASLRPARAGPARAAAAVTIVARQGHQLADHPDRLLVLPDGRGGDPQARHDAEAGADRGADRRGDARRHEQVRHQLGAQRTGYGQIARRDAQPVELHGAGRGTSTPARSRSASPRPAASRRPSPPTPRTRN